MIMAWRRLTLRSRLTAAFALVFGAMLLAYALAVYLLIRDRFAAELQTMGFSRETYRAEHNRVIHDLFQREGLTVTVYTRGEADTPPEKITHACVQMVLIN